MRHVIKILKFLILATTITLNAKTQLYIEGYAGGMFGWSKMTYLKIKNMYEVDGLNASLNGPAKETHSTFAGGLKFGLWFDKSGSVKFEGPDWLKHLGIYLDLSFNPLTYRRKIIPVKMRYTENSDAYKNSHTINTKISLSSKGSSETLAFMLALRANYLKTKEIPTGRIQPYLGIGPSVLFANQKFKLAIAPHILNEENFSIFLKNLHKIRPQNKSSKSGVCLSIDTGLRQMLSPNLSLDYSLKYRITSLSFSFDSEDEVRIKNRYSLFNLQLGLAYHF